MIRNPAAAGSGEGPDARSICPGRTSLGSLLHKVVAGGATFLHIQLHLLSGVCSVLCTKRSRRDLFLCLGGGFFADWLCLRFRLCRRLRLWRGFRLRTVFAGDLADGVGFGPDFGLAAGFATGFADGFGFASDFGLATGFATGLADGFDFASGFDSAASAASASACRRRA